MNLTVILIGIAVVLGTILSYYRRQGRKMETSHRVPDRPFPGRWRQILEEEIEFYKRLSRPEKRDFEHRVHVFLLNVQVIGVDTEVTHEDRVMVAASAVIPIFRMQHWNYAHLKEVQIHPDEFLIPERNQMAKGLTGHGAMQGKMFLSRKAMIEGYADPHDQVNVALHEFVHILDKQDGRIDGVLDNLMREADLSHWEYIVEEKMREINSGNSTIRDYGGTNKAEFLAVVSEFYFESPTKMKEEHPALFMALESIYNPQNAESIKGRTYW